MTETATHPRPELESTITCPNCAHREAETMPEDYCLFFYDCTGCGARLKPRPGDCCVFCSFGSRRCPPKEAACCAESTGTEAGQ